MNLPLNILVIDACPTTRSVVATLVRTAGHSVVVAEDGSSAFELLGSQTPDLILTESRLPDIDGVEFISRLRSHPRTADALIFTISAEQPAFRGRGAEAAINGWLGKPLCRETLMRLVEAVAWNHSSVAAVAEADRPARVAA